MLAEISAAAAALGTATPTSAHAAPTTEPAATARCRPASAIFTSARAVSSIDPAATARCREARAGVFQGARLRRVDGHHGGRHHRRHLPGRRLPVGLCRHRAPRLTEHAHARPVWPVCWQVHLPDSSLRHHPWRDGHVPLPRWLPRKDARPDDWLHVKPILRHCPRPLSAQRQRGVRGSITTTTVTAAISVAVTNRRSSSSFRPITSTT